MTTKKEADGRGPGRPRDEQVARRASRVWAQAVRVRLTGKFPRRDRRQPPLSEAERRALGRLRVRDEVRKRVLDLREIGVSSYREMARDPQIVRILGKVVSGPWLSQIVLAPRDDGAWDEDTARAIREYTRHLRTEDDPRDMKFWTTEICPRLFARAAMDEPEWVVKRVPLLAEEQTVLPATGSRSRRRWELDLRNLIIGHLWFKEWPRSPPISESRSDLRELAQKFKLSPRTLCRILIAHGKTLASRPADEAGRDARAASASLNETGIDR